MADELTPRQREVLGFIASRTAERGLPPSVREIAAHFGMRSTNAVTDHLRALERKGYLRHEGLKSRARWLVRMPDGEDASVARWRAGDCCDVPVIGRVAAGRPILAVENIERTVRVARSLLGAHRDVFGVRVIGDSMVDAGIFDGDLAFVRQAPAAEPGDIVVAMIDDEVTVKRYRPGPDGIRFEPANASMSPIVIRRADVRAVRLIGVVVGVYRRLLSQPPRARGGDAR